LLFYFVTLRIRGNRSSQQSGEQNILLLL